MFHRQTARVSKTYEMNAFTSAVRCGYTAEGIYLISQGLLSSACLKARMLLINLWIGGSFEFLFFFWLSPKDVRVSVILPHLTTCSNILTTFGERRKIVLMQLQFYNS